MQNRLKILIRIMFTLLVSAPIEARAEKIADAFQMWVNNDLRSLATAKGISLKTFDSSLSNVKLNLDLPDLVLPGKKPKVPVKQNQAEFSSPANYFTEKTIAPLVSGGKARSKQYDKTLTAIEKKYGVPRGIILAIWGRESGFGKVQGSYSAFDVLATKAFLSIRKDLFLKEILAALEIVEKGYASPDMMKTSWAGAMGQPQFLPSSYLEHAVDFDGDGRRDIWRSAPDTMASIANYLVHYGWEKGRVWGWEVLVPDDVSCALEGPDQGKSLSAWTGAGITGINTQAFNKAETGKEQFLMTPAGRSGPQFLATANFYVIKNYNISDLYALFIGHVADRISTGGSEFVTSWGVVDTLNRSDIAAIQDLLVSKGYDVGKPDGLPGFKTRRSIGDWQTKNGMEATCFPSIKLKRVLK
jgi:lytic murein transglycosylase